MRTEPLAPTPADPHQALAPYEAGKHGPWDTRLAAHLLRRALGGATHAAIDSVSATGLPQALTELFAPRDASFDERFAELGSQISATQERENLAAMWLMKLASDSRAPGSRLTLFWHDHFACGISKVQDLAAMWQQHQRFVEFGEGPFQPLLLEMARDPAMLRFLDGDTNRRGAPNENLAREILELFSLGVGNYTEQDIQEAARALTGRTVRAGAYAFVEPYHDPGEKRVLGEKVAEGDDLCKAAVAQPACPRFLAKKLWQFYVSPEVSDEILDLLAERWRAQDLEVAWLVRTLLASRAFHSLEAYRSLVKSPVDLVVGVVRTLDSKPDFPALVRRCDSMGQRLFEPPGVQGWEEGEAWIHSSAWLERTNFAAAVTAGEQHVTRDAKLSSLFPTATRNEPNAAVNRLLDVFLQSDLSDRRERELLAAVERAPKHDEAAFRTAAHAVLCLPEYHLL